jgi:hypothetical protein
MADQAQSKILAEIKQDVFGRKGDFITSPEISQVFGEVSPGPQLRSMIAIEEDDGRMHAENPALSRMPSRFLSRSVIWGFDRAATSSLLDDRVDRARSTGTDQACRARSREGYSDGRYLEGECLPFLTGTFSLVERQSSVD